MADLVERLRAACNGHPHAKIEWPHRILHEAADALEAAEKALANIIKADAEFRASMSPDTAKDPVTVACDEAVPTLAAIRGKT